ncbi:MAG: helix-turn-helix domain-containing protein [Spirochaetes bacterium]|nr:helix-turn-helix domain-containing protein [Spirochaetota bacterium]MBN2772305.1 helix-turn-helix domain-containing protein [Spirochaetota bacterium]
MRQQHWFGVLYYLRQYVPGNWTKYVSQKEALPGRGYATYRLKVLLGDRDDIFAFKIPIIATAYRLYLNNKLISSVGNVDDNVQGSIPAYRSLIVSFFPDSDILDLVIHVSNFHHCDGGIKYSIILGIEKELLNMREKRIYLDFILFGSLIIMSFYHFLLFYQRKKDSSPLYFSIACLAIAMRVLLDGEIYLINFIPDINWQLFVKMEYLSFYIIVPFVSMFLFSLFPDYVSKIYVRITQIITFLFSLFVVIVPVKISSLTSVIFEGLTISFTIYLVFVLVIAALRKRTGALIFLFGFFVLTLSTINDILHANGIIKTSYLVPFGILFFIFSQVLILSKRYSIALSISEKHAEHLDALVVQKNKELHAAQQTVFEYKNYYIKSYINKLDTEALVSRLKFLMDEMNIYRKSNLKISELADEMQISSHQLSELLNKKLGKSFSLLINEKRIEEAKYLLLNDPDKRIIDIAYFVGYNSISSFNTTFKRLENISPSAIRRNNSPHDF